MIFHNPDNRPPIPWSKLAAGTLLIILFFGLRPKGLRFENPVSILPEKGAIHFRTNGIAFANDVFTSQKPQLAGDFTIELAARTGAEAKRGFRTLLMIHDGDDRRQLFIGQYRSSLVVMNGDDFDHTRKFPRAVADDVLAKHALRLITITPGQWGTRVYVDGVLSGAREGWRLDMPLEGEPRQMVVGNSVYGGRSWSGEIYGVAVYGQSLSPDAVKRHFDEWKAQGWFPNDERQEPLLFYTFHELHGRQAPDLAGHNPSLQIPSRFMALKRKFLSVPSWPLKADAAFWGDVVINVIGFIPLGAVLCGWVRFGGRRIGKYGSLGVLLFCFSVSFVIEILQGWMPTRSSSLLDLTLNTLGAWMGMRVMSWMDYSGPQFSDSNLSCAQPKGKKR